MSEYESAQWTEQMESVFGLDLRASTDLVQGELSNAALGNVATFKIAGTPQALKRTSVAIGRSGATPVEVCALESGTVRILCALLYFPRSSMRVPCLSPCASCAHAGKTRI